MPRYEYKCRECEVQLQVTHSIKTRLTNCESCGGEGTLYRLVSNFSTSGLENTKSESKEKPGKVVNNFIKNAKQEIKDYKNDITKNIVGIEDLLE